MTGSVSSISTPAPAPATVAATPPAQDISGRRPGHEARARKKALARNVRHGVLAVALGGAALLAVQALRPRPVPVDLAHASRGPLVVAIDETGVTRVKDRYVVSAPVTGRVSRLALEPGDVVHDGDPLVEIAPALSPLLDERTRAEAEARLGAALSTLGQARSQASRAKVAREQAELELTRTSKLFSNGTVPQQTLDQAEFALRLRGEEESSAQFSTKVALEEARAARVALGRDGQAAARDRHVDVLSPVSGRILRVHQKSAGLVQAGTQLMEVGNPNSLEVVVDLLTTDAVHVASGTPVLVHGWGGEAPIDGRVRHVEPSAFTRPSALGVDEQRVNVIVTLTGPEQKWAALGDGYRVQARLVLWQASSVVKVPLGATFRHGDGWAVFRVEDRVAVLTPVRIGHRSETEAEVLSGIAPGAAVAVHPGDRVKDRVRVEAR